MCGEEGVSVRGVGGLGALRGLFACVKVLGHGGVRGIRIAALMGGHTMTREM